MKALISTIIYIIFIGCDFLKGLYAEVGEEITVGPGLLYEVAEDFLRNREGNKERVYFLFALEKPGETVWNHASCGKIIFGLIPARSRNAIALLEKINNHFDADNPLSSDHRFILKGTCQRLAGRELDYIEVTAVETMIYVDAEE